MTLSLAAQSRLAELEEVVEAGMLTFVEVGNALREIRDEKLYRQDFATFEDYCDQRWGFVASRARQLIAGAESVTTVTTAGLPAPANERQARELLPLLREDEVQAVELWRELRAEHGDAVTAATIREAVSERRRFERHAETTRNINSSESFEWYTPGEYVEAARAVLGGIDLDPASSELANETVRATEFFTEEDDGLSRQWRGRVWLNPPYGRLCPGFVAKLSAEYEGGRVSEAILLVSAYSTETRWFQPLFERPICFTAQRIAFYSPSGRGSSSTHGSALVYFGPNPERFAEVFAPFGAIVGGIIPAEIVRRGAAAIEKQAARRERERELDERRERLTAEALAERERLEAAGERPFLLELADVRTWRPAGPVHAVVSDPPYITGDALDLYAALADFALDVLEPGGALAAMTTPALLKPVLAAMDRPQLAYRWTIVWRYATHEKGCDFPRRVFGRWKPIVVFHKGAMPADAPMFDDIIDSAMPEKDLHAWQQSLGGFVRLVKSLTWPGQVVCDPFAGAGTTAVAALQQERRFVGCDIDPEAIATAERRLTEWREAA